LRAPGCDFKPGFNLLEGTLEVKRVNARDAKGYQARKTDVIDAEGLDDLLHHGWLKPSFIPPWPLPELRELRRDRDSPACR
jgi:hypothetical protein